LCKLFKGGKIEGENGSFFGSKKIQQLFPKTFFPKRENQEEAAPPPLEDSSIPRIVAAVGEEEEQQISISLNSSSLPWK